MRRDQRNTHAVESNLCVFSARERTVWQQSQVEGECCHQYANLPSCAKRLCIKHTTSKQIKWRLDMEGIKERDHDEKNGGRDYSREVIILNISISGEGGVIIWGGAIIRVNTVFVLFTGRWVYNWRAFKWGRLMNGSLQYCTCKPLPHLIFLIRATGRKVSCTSVKLWENKCHKGEITWLSKLSTLEWSYWFSLSAFCQN